MNYGRRQFLAAGAALAAARSLPAQAAEPFTLEFPDMPVGETETVDIAVAASAPCTMELRFVASTGHTVLELPQWKLEANRAQSAVMNKIMTGSPGGSVTVRASIRPNGTTRPNLAGVIRPATRGIDRDELERTAESARFQEHNEPQDHYGSFTVTLAVDSEVLLRIYESRPTLGAPIYELRRHIQRGNTPIRWYLRTKGGARAAPGEYVATLDATPVRGGDATRFFSSFQLA